MLMKQDRKGKEEAAAEDINFKSHNYFLSCSIVAAFHSHQLKGFASDQYDFHQIRTG